MTSMDRLMTNTGLWAKEGDAMITAVVGAQYGSEGKGVIVHHLADQFGVHVRTGGPQAGHSFWHKGKVWKMRQIPVGWTNDDATLIIGAGAVVSLDVLEAELREIPLDYNVPDRLIVDPRAVVVQEHHRDNEAALGMRDSIGSTLEGVGQARMAHMSRHAAGVMHVGDLPQQYLRAWSLRVEDTVRILHDVVGPPILLEGTQGFGLSLTHGQWPFVTSHDTTAMQLLADCGLSSADLLRVIMVARTFPIRVGGNSGPLAGEMSWEEMSLQARRPVEEKTTVTGRVRRIGAWNQDMVRRAKTCNGATHMALMFMDYLFPECEGIAEWRLLPSRVHDFVQATALSLSIRLRWIGTGGPRFAVVEVPR